MGIVQQAVGRVSGEQRDGDPVEVFKGLLVVFLCFLLEGRELVFVFEGDAVRDDAVDGADLDIDHAGDFPGLEDDAEALAEEDHPGGALGVVEEVEEDDGLHEDVGEDGAHADADVVFLVAPVGDVVFEGEHFEDGVQEGDDGGGPEEVDVGFDEDTLELFELGAGVGRTANARLRGLLFEGGIEGGVYLEFPVGGRGEVDVDGKGPGEEESVSLGRRE